MSSALLRNARRGASKPAGAGLLTSQPKSAFCLTLGGMAPQGLTHITTWRAARSPLFVLHALRPALNDVREFAQISAP